MAPSAIGFATASLCFMYASDHFDIEAVMGASVLIVPFGLWVE